MITARTMIASYKERLFWEMKARETLEQAMRTLRVPELVARGQALLAASDAKIEELQLCMSKLEAIA